MVAFVLMLSYLPWSRQSLVLCGRQNCMKNSWNEPVINEVLLINMNSNAPAQREEGDLMCIFMGAAFRLVWQHQQPSGSDPRQAVRAEGGHTARPVPGWWVGGRVAARSPVLQCALLWFQLDWHLILFVKGQSKLLFFYSTLIKTRHLIKRINVIQGKPLVEILVCQCSRYCMSYH